jgi:hypothetical protein
MGNATLKVIRILIHDYDPARSIIAISVCYTRRPGNAGGGSAYRECVCQPKTAPL